MSGVSQTTGRGTGAFAETFKTNICRSQTTATTNIKKLFSSCKKRSKDFDACIKRAFNKLRPYFNRGIPDMGVAPFDPHFAKEVKQIRNLFGMGYTLTLHDVFERGWTQSTVTKYKTDWENQQIIYSQYFPEKWLEGDYEFKGDVLGLDVLRSGRWNLTLRDYSQTTRIKRNGEGVEVHVEVDHIGDMDIHVGNLLRGRSVMEMVLDRIINATWKPGFAMIRPLINDLVSTAFTDIWSKSFRNFPIQNFIHD
ncbi:hypothetical protein KGM_208701 [Danaus plexippus plexippus]|uniref:Uncharacterized protein n=1 Tax=Danaus plexippus plexippus TaxID=278856 RepID=A0A212ENR5_DANPL|nr:hypothetical protein KGM_208701 [Danaus plexippus plexippus]